MYVSEKDENRSKSTKVTKENKATLFFNEKDNFEKIHHNLVLCKMCIFDT